jgi:hypothetical protein
VHLTRHPGAGRDPVLDKYSCNLILAIKDETLFVNWTPACAGVTTTPDLAQAIPLTKSAARLEEGRCAARRPLAGWMRRRIGEADFVGGANPFLL